MLRAASITLTAIAAVAVLGGAAPASAAAGKPNGGALMTVSDGQGSIRLIWFTPEGVKPRAWRLEEEASGQSRVIEARITDSTGAAPTAPRPAAARDPATDQALRTLGQALQGMQVMGDWQLAQARGMARELHDVPGGERRYRVVPLGAGDKALMDGLRGRPVDSRKADPLPPPVSGLKILAVRGGADLYWQPGSAPRVPPAVAWRVERDGTPLDASPLLLGARWPADRAAFTDRSAPLEMQLTYRIAMLDVFGRQGPWTEASAFVADVAALDPPLGLKADAARDGIRLGWQGSANPHTAGYLPERSPLRSGPYEALTTSGVAHATTSFLDKGAEPGVGYYYRLRAMDPRGVLGEPTLPVFARLATGAPPAPAAPKAEAGTSQVTLRWDPLPGIAGYYLQRRVAGSGSWTILNDALTPEPRYDDTGLPSGARFDYRVIAVGHDSRESEPGPVVSVALTDTEAPGTPNIVAASGADGRVQLRLAPAEPAAATAQVLVLRGGADDPGVVIGDPLPGTQREWTDDWVLAGETYWYRLVALDAAGNRSTPGNPVAVRVGSGSIPQPKPPQVRPVTAPFAGIELQFAPVPGEFAILVQRRTAGTGVWQTVAGPLSGTRMIDTRAPAGALEYRLVLRARDGAEGVPSAATAVNRP